MTQLRASSLLFFATLMLVGCKPDAALKKAEVIGKGSLPVTTPAPSVDAGSVTGTIRFNGKAPARTPIDMSMDPACAMSAAQNSAEQFIVANGKLANVYVYIKSGAAPSQVPTGTPPVVMDQKGCRYVPHVIALQQGGSVEFRNSDPTMHNIHATPPNDGTPSIDVSQGPMGAPQVRQFTTPQTMLPVRCNNHPWMNAFINVADTPFFAVTGADGSFSIGGLPPGTYTLAAVQEKLGEQDMQIVVPAKGDAKADFTFAAK